MAQQLSKLTPEMLVPRLGEYLIQRELLNEADLKKALDHQQREKSAGRQVLLGQAMVELKLVDREVLDQAVTEQILQLRAALQASNRSLEQRVAERTNELEAAIKRLSELNQMKANFVANISHELRTPLTHIKGYLDLLISDSMGRYTQEQRLALDVCKRSTARLEGLIEDLILFGLATRGEMSIRLEKVDIQKLISQAVNGAAAKAEERGVNVTFTNGPNLPWVQADPERIGWVLNQLLDNGIKFTSSGGSVVVRVKEESPRFVSVSVADTGIGIPSNRIHEIFEPFHQLDGSSTRHHGGTGLGLSLVRQIVEAHGSVLDVQSTEGKGSVFKFPLLSLRD